MTPIAEQLRQCSVELSHHFVGARYAKVSEIPAGVKLDQHAHRFPHESALLIGTVLLEVDGERTELTAPALLTIEANKGHEVTALTPALWVCLWPNDDGETDVSKLDERVIA